MKNLKSNYKLIYICENDLTLQIGGTIHVKEVLASLAKLHHDITLIAPDYHGEKITIDYNIKTIFIKTWNITIIKWLYFYIASTFYILRLFLKSQKIIVYSREMSYNVFLPILTKLLHIPLFIEINGILLKEMEDLNYSSTSYLFTKGIEKFILKSANHIIAVSDEIKITITEMLNISPKKITVVPNGTDIKRFTPLEKERCRRQLNIDQSKYIIGFIGSCYPYHDIDTLISTVPELIDKIPNIHIYIVGSGYMLDNWKKLSLDLKISNRVTFTDYVPFELANQYINSFDICYAIYKENVFGVGMKIMDYMACNSLIITSDLPAFKKVFTRTPYLQLVKPESKLLLVKAILDLYSKRNEPIKEHREIIINNYTWDHTARKIIKIIEDS